MYIEIFGTPLIKDDRPVLFKPATELSECQTDQANQSVFRDNHLTLNRDVIVADLQLTTI